MPPHLLRGCCAWQATVWRCTAAGSAAATARPRCNAQRPCSTAPLSAACSSTAPPPSHSRRQHRGQLDCGLHAALRLGLVLHRAGGLHGRQWCVWGSASGVRGDAAQEGLDSLQAVAPFFSRPHGANPNPAPPLPPFTGLVIFSFLVVEPQDIGFLPQSGSVLGSEVRCAPLLLGPAAPAAARVLLVGVRRTWVLLLITCAAVAQPGLGSGLEAGCARRLRMHDARLVLIPLTLCARLPNSPRPTHQRPPRLLRAGGQRAADAAQRGLGRVGHVGRGAPRQPGNSFVSGPLSLSTARPAGRPLQWLLRRAAVDLDCVCKGRGRLSTLVLVLKQQHRCAWPFLLNRQQL